MKKLIDFGTDDDLDRAERYLWSVSVATHPKIEIIKGKIFLYLFMFANFF